MKFKLLTVLIVIATLSSCDKEDCIEGNGPVVAQELYAPDFDAVKAEGSLDIFIEDGDEQVVEAVGHSNIIDYLLVDEIGGTLHIELENDCYRDYELAIYISTPSIERVELDGSGNIDIAPMEMDNDLELEIDGSGDIDFNSLEGVQNLQVEIDGSGTVRGHDSWDDLINLEIDIEGSGDYRGFDVMTENCEISISGSGDCRVFVTDNLDIIINGSGDVYYKGNPNIFSSISGSGDVIDAN
ncbi:MAG: DUF2807 domain-containing protein [Flavobacteriales bacterium]|nr:DUF2807 domain-containing protein [Flavobacteriales bacterium]